MRRPAKPPWVRRFRWWITETADEGRPSREIHPAVTRLGAFLDRVDPTWELWDRFVSKPWLRVECTVFGHVTIDDQCGIASHRYCAICGAARPNKPVTA